MLSDPALSHLWVWVALFMCGGQMPPLYVLNFRLCHQKLARENLSGENREKVENL